MMSALRKVLIGLIGLIVLILAGALIAPAFIDHDSLKQRIETAVLDATGQRPRIDGPLRLRLLPTPRAELGAIAVPADDSTVEPQLHIERLRIDLAVMPLLSGRIVLNTVAIDGLRLSLAPVPAVSPAPIAMTSRSPTPIGWSPPSRPAASSVPPADAMDSTVSSGMVLIASESARGRAPLPQFPPVQRLLLHDAEVHRRVSSTGAEITLRVPMLSAGPLAPGAQGLVDAQLSVTGRRPRLDGDLSLTATLDLAEDLSTLHLSPMRVSGDDLSILDLAGLPLVLDAQLSWRPMSETLSIDDLSAELGALRLIGQGDIAPGPRGMRLAAQLRVLPVDLRRWLETHLDQPIPGTTQTLRSVTGRGLIALEQGELELGQVRLSVDESNAAGAARLWLISGALPTGVAAVTLDQLDIDPYLALPRSPPPGHGPRDPVTVTAADAPSEADPSLPEPTADRLLVSLSADAIRAGGLAYREATILAGFDAAGWTADIEADDFYGGPVDALATGSRPATPAEPMPLTLTGAARDVDIGALLADTVVKAQLRGRGRVELDLSASGGNSALIRRSLGGNLALAVEDGAIAGLDLERLLGTASGQGNAGNASEGPAMTAFSLLSASASGEEGLFRSSDIRARSPLVHIDGRGAIDVVAETLALELEAILVEPPSGAGIRELEGTPIPIEVSGPWTDPQWRADIGSALRQALDERLKKEGGLLQQLEERTGIPGLRDGLERGLKGLLGQ